MNFFFFKSWSGLKMRIRNFVLFLNLYVPSWSCVLFDLTFICFVAEKIEGFMLCVVLIFQIWEIHIVSLTGLSRLVYLYRGIGWTYENWHTEMWWTCIVLMRLMLLLHLSFLEITWHIHMLIIRKLGFWMQYTS